MIPGIPDFLLSGGQGGLTVAPSSSATSGYTRTELAFGNSTSTAAGGNASTSTFNPSYMLIAGAVLVAAAFFVGRK